MADEAHTLVYAEALAVGDELAFLGPDAEFEWHEIRRVLAEGDMFTVVAGDQPKLRLRRGTVCRIKGEQ